jgi:hypothetical protein
MGTEGPIHPDTFVGDILTKYPALRGKILELFGAECLSCRSNLQETVTYTSWHKGLDPKKVVSELNALLKPK